MTQKTNPRAAFDRARELNWLEKAGLFVLAAAIIVVSFFFLAIALVAGTMLAVFALLRWWWIARKLRRAAKQDAIEGEYIIVRRSTDESLVERRHDQG
jgi:MFS superfamily sulfate permease-like transporter